MILRVSKGAVAEREAIPAIPPAAIKRTKGISLGGRAVGAMSEPMSKPARAC